jgi:hypothetical protein
MRRTKRRVLKSKTRVLKSKISVLKIRRRRTQRKFKYQRGGETDEELIVKIDEAIEEVKAKEDEIGEQELLYQEKRNDLLYASLKVRELRYEMTRLEKIWNDAKKPGKYFNNFTSTVEKAKAAFNAGEEKLKIAEENLTRLTEEMKIFRPHHKSSIEKLYKELHGPKEKAVLLLQKFIDNFPEEKAVLLLQKFIDNFPKHANFEDYKFLLNHYKKGPQIDKYDEDAESDVAKMLKVPYIPPAGLRSIDALENRY